MDLLELRLSEIERQVYGYPMQDLSIAETNNSTLSLVKMLMEIENKLKTITIGKDAFNQCYNDMKKIQKWIGDDNKFDSLLSSFGSHSSVVKFEEVLAFEDEIRMDYERMLELEQLLPSLNEKHLGSMDQLEPILIKQKLQLYNLHQKCLILNKCTEQLISEFNSW